MTSASLLPWGVKVGAALAAAHGQAGQAVLEHLLKAQELDDGQIDAGMQAQAALVGADGAVELHAVAAVDLHLAVVVDPRHAEQHGALGLDDALDDAVLFQLRPRLNDGLQALEYLFDRLQKFLLLGVALGKALVHARQIRVFDRHLGTLSFSGAYTATMVADRALLCKVFGAVFENFVCFGPAIVYEPKTAMYARPAV